MTRRLRLLVVAATLAVIAGCGGLPDSGPLEVGEAPAGPEQAVGVPFAPPPPQRGEDPSEIVQHFLDAMTANPIQVSVARQFLSRSARDAWQPDQRMITYAGAPALSGETATIEVVLSGANWLDSHGSWRGPLADSGSRITFPLTSEEGEWRIAEAPNAMIVPEQWFEERFQQVALYFFDSTLEILVPEPVFVPRGDQLPTSLVRGLLQGPTREMRGELRSFLPAGATLADVSVPVEEGVAEVALTGDQAMAAESIDRLAAQIAWTLRQDPTLTAARVTIGDAPVTLSRGTSEFSVDEGHLYDPAGAVSSTGVFGLRRGRLVQVFPPELFSTDGALGSADLGVRDISLSLDGNDVVGVTADGTTILGAAVDTEGGRPPRPRTLLEDATDLLHPAWDHAGRLWVLDRTSRGARVLVREGGAFHPVRVPGVSGETVVDFLVSRDGTRLVAALGSPGDQTVVTSRLLTGRTGVTATDARIIAEDQGGDAEILDLGWRTATDIVVLSSVNRRLSEVHTVSVDGSPATPSGVPSSELLRENAAGLLSAPNLTLSAWLVTRGGAFVELSPVQSELAPDRRVVAATYVG